MESWHLPNLSVQIAPDCISEYLNFQNFPGGPPLVSRDFLAPNGRSRAQIANILNYATPGLTNKKRLGTPLITDSQGLHTCNCLLLDPRIQILIFRALVCQIISCKVLL